MLCHLELYVLVFHVQSDGNHELKYPEPASLEKIPQQRLYFDRQALILHYQWPSV